MTVLWNFFYISLFYKCFSDPTTEGDNMSESQNTKSLTLKQYDFIVSLFAQLKAHLNEDEVAKLSARLETADQQTQAWGSAAIEKLKRVQTQVNLAKAKADREKLREQREKLAAAN